MHNGLVIGRQSKLSFASCVLISCSALACGGCERRTKTSPAHKTTMMVRARSHVQMHIQRQAPCAEACRHRCKPHSVAPNDVCRLRLG